MTACRIALFVSLAGLGCSASHVPGDDAGGGVPADARLRDAAPSRADVAVVPPDAPIEELDAPLPDAPPPDAPPPDAGPCPLPVVDLHGTVGGVDLASLEPFESQATTACPVPSGAVRLRARGAEPGSFPEVAIGYAGAFSPVAVVGTDVTTAGGTTHHEGTSETSNIEARGDRYWLTWTYTVAGADAGGRVDVPYCDTFAFCL